MNSTPWPAGQPGRGITQPRAHLWIFDTSTLRTAALPGPPPPVRPALSPVSQSVNDDDEAEEVCGNGGGGAGSAFADGIAAAR